MPLINKKKSFHSKKKTSWQPSRLVSQGVAIELSRPHYGRTKFNFQEHNGVPVLFPEEKRRKKRRMMGLFDGGHQNEAVGN